MNKHIQESIERFRKKFYPQEACSGYIDGIKTLDGWQGSALEAFLKSELELIAKKVEEDTTKQILRNAGVAFINWDENWEEKES